MSAIALVDTSVLLNLIPVPGADQQFREVHERFIQLQREHAELVLPLVALVEAGNRVARLADGADRYRCAARLVSLARAALRREAPFILRFGPTAAEFGDVLDGLPDQSKQEIGFADAAILDAYHRVVETSPGRRVFIWTFDAHLRGYDTGDRSPA